MTRIILSLLAAAALAAGLTVAVAAPAEAASDRTWEALAGCESGHRWHINTGNGYYGGLQFSDPTWDGYGGERYAAYAHQATRRQQIRIAEGVLAGQGWNAWPYCADRLGLR
jgi:resuscitation-promoting factor RpfA